MAERVAFIGLGVMGQHMARHLVRAGHDVTVFNRTRARASQFVEAQGGRLAETPADAARDAMFVLICVGNDEHVRAVTMGAQGALEGLAPGGLMRRSQHRVGRAGA